MIATIRNLLLPGAIYDDMNCVQENDLEHTLEQYSACSILGSKQNKLHSAAQSCGNTLHALFVALNVFLVRSCSCSAHSSGET